MLALVSLKASLNLASAQRVTIVQALSDAFLSRELAYASRLPFEELVDSEQSLWPTYPLSSDTEVEIGKLPGSVPVIARLVRTKYPSDSNLISKGGTSYITGNPSKTEVWHIKSYLSYQVARRTYVKTANSVRVR